MYSDSSLARYDRMGPQQQLADQNLPYVFLIAFPIQLCIEMRFCPMTYPFQNPDLPLEERVNGINLNCIARIHQMCLFPAQSPDYFGSIRLLIIRMVMKDKSRHQWPAYERQIQSGGLFSFCTRKVYIFTKYKKHIRFLPSVFY